MNILHIYGQFQGHDPVFICGNRQALIELRNTIDKALEANEVAQTLSVRRAIEDWFNL